LRLDALPTQRIHQGSAHSTFGTLNFGGCDGKGVHLNAEGSEYFVPMCGWFFDLFKITPCLMYLKKIRNQRFIGFHKELMVSTNFVCVQINKFI